MAGDPQKTPLAQTQSAFTLRRAVDEIAKTGRALPCRVTAVSGQMVTVAFEVTEALLPPVTIPLATWLYDWVPVRAGDRGLTLPADARLGGISGQGGGTADLTQTANLSALMFVPCANTAWSVPDATQRVVQGPGGVLARTVAGDALVNVTPAAITMICQGHTLLINSTGIMFDGIQFSTHVHSGVQTGASNTGPPV